MVHGLTGTQPLPSVKLGTSVLAVVARNVVLEATLRQALEAVRLVRRARFLRQGLAVVRLVPLVNMQMPTILRV